MNSVDRQKVFVVRPKGMTEIQWSVSVSEQSQSCKPQQGAVTDRELGDVPVTVIDHDGAARP